MGTAYNCNLLQSRTRQSLSEQHPSINVSLAAGHTLVTNAPGSHAAYTCNLLAVPTATPDTQSKYMSDEKRTTTEGVRIYDLIYAKKRMQGTTL